MDLDLLNENYTTVMSKLTFEQLSQADLTGSPGWSNQSYQTCQIWVSTDEI
jgi:hypothetical protein